MRLEIQATPDPRDGIIELEAPAPLSNAAGEVILTPVGEVRIRPIYPADAVARWRAAGVCPPDECRATVRDGALILGQAQAGWKSGPLGLRLEGRHELAALVANAAAIQQAICDAREARRVAAREIERRRDEALANVARIEAEEYAAAIPADHVILAAEHDAAAADGWGSTDYAYQGVGIRWDFPGLITRQFMAVRPGAMGAFFWRVVAHAPRTAVEAHVAAERTKSEERRQAIDARRAELLATPIPPAALAAYDRYHGSADAAWEAGDESAWSQIRHWAEAIEAQNAAPAAELQRAIEQAAEAAREERAGLGEGA